MRSKSDDNEKQSLLKYGSTKIKDHFSLSEASARVRFNDTNTQNIVWSEGSQQIVLEDDVDEEGKSELMRLKSMNVDTNSLKALRALYSLVCLFWVGYIIVFCINLLLFIVMDLLIFAGATSDSDKQVVAFAWGVLLSFPLYIYGLSQLLVIAGSYVIDTWNGHILLKKTLVGVFEGTALEGNSAIVLEWMTFSVFLGIPIMVLCFTLFMGRPDFWDTTSVTWLYLIGSFYFLYAIALIKTELHDSFVLTRNYEDFREDGEYNNSANFWETLHRAIVFRQRHVYSGSLKFNYFTQGFVDYDGEELEPDESWYSKFVKLGFLNWLNLFRAIDENKYGAKKIKECGGQLGIEIYDIEDVQDRRPFISKGNWSLEKIFCRNEKSRYIVIAGGPSAVTAAQIKSSGIFALIMYTIFLAIFASVSHWYKLPVSIIMVIELLMIAFIYPRLKQSYKIMKALIPVKEKLAIEGNAGEDSAIYQVWRNYRVTEPTTLLCYIIFSLEVVFFYLVPLYTLFAVGNWKIAVLFFILAGISGVRTYFDPATILEVTHSLDFVSTPDERNNDPALHWTKKSRLSTIISTVTRSYSLLFYVRTLGFVLFAFVALGFLSSTENVKESFDTIPQTFLPDFEYKEHENLSYPTCNVGSSSKLIDGLIDGETAGLADYIFISGLAYKDSSIVQPQLDQWFGEGVATDEVDLVKNYRSSINDRSSVQYKLISFNHGTEKPTALLSVRGTATAADTLADAQLWIGAIGFQLTRFVVPFGSLFTPVLNKFVTIIAWLASDSIERVAFYKETTAFANKMKEDPNFGKIQVTGHSLGGGIAMITAAQSEIPGVAVSGPNAMISRQTFTPPLDVDKLNSMTFNVIPDRDVVPMIDDRAELFQEIRCITEFGDFVGCHTVFRSLCEVMFSCGSGNRPALCTCYKDYGYPPPVAKNGTTRTIEEACSV